MNSTARLGLFLSLTATVIPVSLAQELTHYVESDGVVVFETESAELGDGWVLGTELPDHTGDGYILWEGGNHYRTDEAGEGALTFRFTIGNPGNYQLLWRSRIARGELDTEHNDSWARMSTGTDVLDEHPLNGWTKAYMNDLGIWSWATKTVDGEGLPLRQHFSAGDHTLEISGRSTGHAIDRVVLLSYETRGNRPETLDALPVSTTSGGSGTPGGGDEGGDEGGGDDGDDDPTGDDGYAPVNASHVEPESETAVENLGQCVDERLVLTPVADVHEEDGDYADEEALTFGGDDRALLKFDLRAVPAPAHAALRFTPLVTLESGVAFALGAHAEWPDDTAAPDFLASLGDAEARWEAGVRHESELDASLFQPELQTLLMSAASGADPFSLASSEDPETGPRLVLVGESGFCAAHDQRLAEIEAEEAAEAEPTAETPPEEVPSEEVPPEETPSGEAPSGEAPSEETPPTETPSVEVPSAETPATAEEPVVDLAVTPAIAVSVAANVPTVETSDRRETPSSTDSDAGSASIWWLMFGALVGVARRRPFRAS